MFGTFQLKLEFKMFLSQKHSHIRCCNHSMSESMMYNGKIISNCTTSNNHRTRKSNLLRMLSVPAHLAVIVCSNRFEIMNTREQHSILEVHLFSFHFISYCMRACIRTYASVVRCTSPTAINMHPLTQSFTLIR